MLPKIMMVCNLAANPLNGVSNKGTEYSRFSVACSSVRTSTNPTPQTHFFNCVAFGKTANYIKSFIKKGDRVFIEGNLTTNSYTNNEGKVIYSVQTYVERIELLKRSAANETASQSSNSLYNNNSFNNDFDDSFKANSKINIDDESIIPSVNFSNQLINENSLSDSDLPINVFEQSSEEETDDIGSVLDDLYDN